MALIDETPQIADTAEFWRWLAAEFKKLLKPSRMAAVYAEVKAVTDGEPSERADFCNLAAKGAIAAGVIGVEEWLNLLRDEASNSYFSGSKKHGGWIEKPVQASVDYCLYRETRALEQGPKPTPNGKSPEQAARAKERQAVVMPILEMKKEKNRTWSRNTLASKAGVSPTCVNEYLDGKRLHLTYQNRKAIADALGIKPEALPN